MYVLVSRVDCPKATWHPPIHTCIPFLCYYRLLLLYRILYSLTVFTAATANTREAYTRFWNALTDTHQMMAAWLEAASSVVAFSRSGSRWMAKLSTGYEML